MNNIKPITPQLTEIKNYTPALKIDDKYFVNGIGGNYIPGGPSNSMNFYKCASVTSDGWAGYKAILNNGVYGFEQNVTSGLNYTSGFIPEIGKIYVDGAMIKSELYTGIPTNGLVFYAPLELDVISSQTDQLIVKEGSGISYQIYKNIPCVRFTSDSYIKIINNLSEIPSGSSPFTISAWCCLLNKSETYGSFAFGYGGAIGREAGIWFSGDAEGNTNNISIDFNNNQGFVTGLTYSLDTWYHCCLVWDGALLKPYINGIAGITASRTVNMDASIISIGVRKQDSQIVYFFDGYVAGCRIYNRALNETEILSLASEFTPIYQN